MMDDHHRGLKQILVMVGVQFIFAGIVLFAKAALSQGLQPTIFSAYRQAIATLIIAPIALYYRRRNSLTLNVGLKSFILIFLAAFFGIAATQNAYFEGLSLTSAGIASAMVNLVPAVTFVIAAATGLEKVDIWSIRSMAKIVGTILCVGGAVTMALFKGTELLSGGPYMEPMWSIAGLQINNWVLGSIILFGGCWCWSTWLILQVPVSKQCPDHLYSTALTCFFGMLQSAVFAFILQKGWKAWRINTAIELGACVFSGVGSALTFFGQTWCVSERGPVFSATFNPVNTIVATSISSIFLHEELYLGSLVGAATVIVGLYIVLWGKAKERETEDNKVQPEEGPATSSSLDHDILLIGMDDEPPHQVPQVGSSNNVNMQEPLLQPRNA